MFLGHWQAANNGSPVGLVRQLGFLDSSALPGARSAVATSGHPRHVLKRKERKVGHRGCFPEPPPTDHVRLLRVPLFTLRTVQRFTLQTIPVQSLGGLLSFTPRMQGSGASVPTRGGYQNWPEEYLSFLRGISSTPTSAPSHPREVCETRQDPQ